jgi:hypothetical protein
MTKKKTKVKDNDLRASLELKLSYASAQVSERDKRITDLQTLIFNRPEEATANARREREIARLLNETDEWATRAEEIERRLTQMRRA